MKWSGEGGNMENWYSEFWAQTWYRNTFLVQHPYQIGRALAGDQEWNNLYDSGCNFTCLAMIIGIDPARLASELSILQKPFFQRDPALPAMTLAGQYSGLVWDRNSPDKGKLLTIPKIWHSKRSSYMKIGIKLRAIKPTHELNDGIKYVMKARSSGHHVICGTTDHSHLVAGSIRKNEYFLWDPDGEEVEIEKNLSGKVTLKQLFDENPGEIVEFWIYEVSFTDAASSKSKSAALRRRSRVHRH
jgi:hypothetical protein